MNIQKLEIETMPPAKSGYMLPFLSNGVEISQGYNGPYSHFATKRSQFGILIDDRFCIDFKLPLGTSVIAAKEGTVDRVVDCCTRFYEGLELEIGLQYDSNLIILKHPDETYTIYSHLALGSTKVRKGDRIEQGQIIAETGKSGWIGLVPHLHFSAFERNEGNWLSFPVIFGDYKGALEHSGLERNMG